MGARVLFIGTLATAAALVIAVLVSPWLPQSLPLVPLFAADLAVRRTALASAAALAVTAFVFFRPSTRPKKPSPNEPPPGTMAGA